MKNSKNKNKSGLNFFFNLMVVLTILVGVGLLAYPTVADWYNQYHSTKLIAGYSDAVSGMTQADFDRLRAEARAYNQEILTRRNRFQPSDAELEAYNNIMDVTGTGIMGYINIPAMNVQLPIYHTVEETVLQIAVGHMPGSSIPIGDTGTHAVLSGHSGLPSARLFTDLETLVMGDIFELHVLDEVLYYQIDAINVVLPEEMDLLAIESGSEHVTLVTCTPYSVNTHRLLVRGVRISAPPDGYLPSETQVSDGAGDGQTEPNPESGPSKLQVAVAVALLVLVVLIIIWIFAGRHDGKSASDANPPDDPSGD